MGSVRHVDHLRPEWGDPWAAMTRAGRDGVHNRGLVDPHSEKTRTDLGEVELNSGERYRDRGSLDRRTSRVRTTVCPSLLLSSIYSDVSGV